MFAETLDKPVKYLKGVGPVRAEILARLGISTVRDLMLYFPKEHDDRRSFKKISGITDGETAAVSVKVEIAGIKNIGPKLAVFKAAVSDNTGVLYAAFFKKPNYRYDVFQKLKKDFVPGSKVMVYGKIERMPGGREMRVEEYEPLGQGHMDTIHTGRIVPIYPLTEGLNGRFLRALIKSALETRLHLVDEIIPHGIAATLPIPSFRKALEQYHFPDSFEMRDKARARIAFEEFLLLGLAMLISKNQNAARRKKREYRVTGELLKPFRNGLGFEFTRAQKHVINEIFSDLQSCRPMNRLLVGDVGSGKTVVALSAALLAMENGHQAAFMAPTEILAGQHFLTIRNFLAPVNVKAAMLTGSTPLPAKRQIRKNLSEGTVQLIVGTHALLERSISFKSLGLVIIDEQHKFGVVQRQGLREKGFTGDPPDVLVMTATPIPRTLALTVYGDLDVSSINELPPGRRPVKTLSVNEQRAYEFVRSELRKGRQAYIVFPLIEESDKMELKSVMGEAENLSKNVFPEFKIGFLHGQMPGERKERIMLDFRDRKIEILASTTVIEIGLDVPNATVMVIEHSERFGLASLHQLRGRVGRAPGVDSYCLLVGDPGTEDSKERIEVMLSTNDGFKIGEIDLRLRGPGKFFGTVQHGLPELKVGDLARDVSLISEARKAAGEILKKGLLEREKPLREALLKAYGDRMDLPRVG